MARGGGAYREIGFHCPRFRYVQGVGASNGGYSRACPVLYQFYLPTFCQPMLCGVYGIAGAASVCLYQFYCSQTVVGGDEVMDHHTPR
jgi:hypothetical protein